MRTLNGNWRLSNWHKSVAFCNRNTHTHTQLTEFSYHFMMMFKQSSDNIIYQKLKFLLLPRKFGSTNFQILHIQDTLRFNSHSAQSRITSFQLSIKKSASHVHSLCSNYAITLKIYEYDWQAPCTYTHTHTLSHKYADSSNTSSHKYQVIHSLVRKLFNSFSNNFSMEFYIRTRASCDRINLCEHCNKPYVSEHINPSLPYLIVALKVHIRDPK